MRADVHGETADSGGLSCDLAGVGASADFDPERSHGFDDRLRASNSAGRPVEGGEEAVPRGVHFHSTVACQHRPHNLVMTSQELLPCMVAEVCRVAWVSATGSGF